MCLCVCCLSVRTLRTCPNARMRARLTPPALQRALLADGRPGEALAAAERAKARALRDLMRRGDGEGEGEGDEEGPTGADEGPTWEEVRRLAGEEGAWVLEYSLLDEGTVAAWVLAPDGRLAAQRIDLGPAGVGMSAECGV